MSARQEKKIRKIYNQQLNGIAKRDFDLYHQLIVGRLKLYQWVSLTLSVVVVVLVVVIVGVCL